MKKKIEEILLAEPGLKAKIIAKRLDVESRDVNVVLYAHPTEFHKSSDHCWYAFAEPTIFINLEGDCWVDSDSFERSLASAGSVLDRLESYVYFLVPKGCKILLEAAVRLMALSNQLCRNGKAVTIDFTSCTTTLSYFDRLAFFSCLNDRIRVMPNRPALSRSVSYKGNNNGVVEFGRIDPVSPDENIPKQLKHCFVAHAGEQYAQPAFTLLSELFGNVRDHANSPIPGFVALQRYGKGKTPRIQTVISDSGAGIVGTLRPVLPVRYPDLAKKFDAAVANSDALLLAEVFKNGRISSSTDDGRGLGLKRSGDVAAKFNGRISVRQETFEVKIRYAEGVFADFSYTLNMPRLYGSHICFDFLLDGGT